MNFEIFFRYADLKGLAGHIEKMHGSSVSPVKKMTPVKTVVASAVVTVNDDEDSNQSQESSADSTASGSYGAGRISITPVKHAQHRGKYKQKEFTCPHCSKGYCDAMRLKDHIETKHEQKNDPWRDVGPNTDIVIRNRSVQVGYEIYKVLGLYSTGLRMKAAKFARVDHDKWVLTEEISKSVMKHDIMMVSETLKKRGHGYFMMDQEEYDKLQTMVTSTKLRLSTIINNDTRNNTSHDNDTVHDNISENDDDTDEVMVQPVFEGGDDDDEEQYDDFNDYDEGEVQIFTNGDSNHHQNESES